MELILAERGESSFLYELIPLTPVALRTAKTLWSFGCSECIGLSRVVVVVDLLFYVHGKHLRSCRDGQLT